MNTRAVNAAAGVIRAAVEQGRTPAGIALALDSAQLLQTPETAKKAAADRAELLALKRRVAEMEQQLPDGGVQRQHVDHAVVAKHCRQVPGEWLFVAEYRNGSDRQLASQVRNGKRPAYAPAGSFEARAQKGRLYVRTAPKAGDAS